MNDTDTRINIDIEGTPFSYAGSQTAKLEKITARIVDMRRSGALTKEILSQIRQSFRIKHIYHSNAIEGNALDIGETKEVVENGQIISGKPWQDQIEARNLAEAHDFVEELGKEQNMPISESHIRQIHQIILSEINNENAGRYRPRDVTISGSEYPPSSVGQVASDMQAFGEWFKTVTSDDSKITSAPLVIAAVAHTWFVQIHPFIDGNGRVARLLLYLILMRANYSPAIITKDDRPMYYDSLEESQTSNLSSFIALLIECINEILDEYEEKNRDLQEWLDFQAKKLSATKEKKHMQEFEIWRSAMELLKSHFSQVATGLNKRVSHCEFWIKNFEPLEYEKYDFLREGKIAKKTWTYRIHCKSGEKTALYLFFFGYASQPLKKKGCNVTIHIAREEPPGSWNYERLSEIVASNVPDIHELGYNSKAEKFVIKGRLNLQPKEIKMDNIGKLFFEEIINKHFSNP